LVASGEIYASPGNSRALDRFAKRSLNVSAAVANGKTASKVTFAQGKES